MHHLLFLPMFLGDMGEKGVFPIIDPTMYAMVSLIQIENIIAQGIRGEYPGKVVVANCSCNCTGLFIPRSISISRGTTM
jgi:hypothetical protein